MFLRVVAWFDPCNWGASCDRTSKDPDVTHAHDCFALSCIIDIICLCPLDICSGNIVALMGSLLMPYEFRNINSLWSSSLILTITYIIRNSLDVFILIILLYLVFWSIFRSSNGGSWTYSGQLHHVPKEDVSGEFSFRLVFFCASLYAELLWKL